MIQYEEGDYCFKQGQYPYTIYYYLASAFRNAHLHREDGPAVEHNTPSRKNRWWLRGSPVPVDNQKNFERYIKLIMFL